MRTPDGLFTLAYDSTTGRVRQMIAPGGSALTLTYDGPLVTSRSWTGAVAGRVSTAFDNDFRLVTERVNDTSTVTFAYDADGLVTTAGALTLTRDATNGRVTATAIGSVASAFSYDALSMPSGITASYSSSGLFDAHYTRDGWGRVVEDTEVVGGTLSALSFRYDSSGRLKTVLRGGTPDVSYEYDANGNRVRTTTTSGVVAASFDVQDRLVASGATTYGYTFNGDLRFKAVGADTTKYRYSAHRELLGVQLPGGTRIDYVVDPNGRRIGKQVNGVLTHGWLYDGDLAVVAELDASGQIASRFIYSGLGSAPEYMVKSGRAYSLVADYLGSVRLVVDAQTGVVAQRIDYDAFGRVTQNTNPGFQPFGFAGGLYDEQTGLVRFGARDYDGETGRWTSKDPLLFRGGDDNLYRYAAGDPINNVDPRGKDYTLAETNNTMVCYAIAVTAGAITAVQALKLARGLDWGGALTEIASPTGDITAQEKCQNQQQGDQFGCMSCGSRDPGTPTGKWINNHVPPKSVHIPGEPFCIGTHCQRCNNRQGGFLRALLEWANERSVDDIVAYIEKIISRW